MVSKDNQHLSPARLTSLLFIGIAGMAFNMGEDVCERMGCDWASPFESTISQQKVSLSVAPSCNT
jgi:hypothetical protein